MERSRTSRGRWVLVLAAITIPFVGGVSIGPASARESRSTLSRADHTAPPSAVTRRRGPVSFSDWPFWYHHNADRMEALAAPHLRLATDGLGLVRREAILERLRALIDGSQAKASIRAGACRALGRALSSADDVLRLVQRLDDKAEDMLLREGAALGLGLMVRSEPVLVLPESAYAEARRALTAVADDPGEHVRLRGLSMLSTALLATQPSSGADPARLASRLVATLSSVDGLADLQVAALHALARLPPEAVGADVRLALCEIVKTGKHEGDDVTPLVQSYAAQALGCVGAAESADVLLGVLGRVRIQHTPNRSIAIAVGELGARLTPTERLPIAREVLLRLDRQRDATARHYLMMSLRRLLVAGSVRDAAHMLEQSRIDETLLKIAETGKYVDRPLAALALAFALRELPGGDVGAFPSIDAFRAEALGVLRVGLHDKVHDTRTAFVLALGLARDAERLVTLRAMAADRGRTPAMRGYALLGVALAAPTLETHSLALEELQRTPGGFHVLAATRALGLTANFAEAPTIRLLARGVRGEIQGAPHGEAAVALARTGRVDAADALLGIVADPTLHGLYVRSGLVGLGRIADPEHAPTLTRLTQGLNYRALTDLLSELLVYL